MVLQVAASVRLSVRVFSSSRAALHIDPVCRASVPVSRFTERTAESRTAARALAAIIADCSLRCIEVTQVDAGRGLAGGSRQRETGGGAGCEAGWAERRPAMTGQGIRYSQLSPINGHR